MLYSPSASSILKHVSMIVLYRLLVLHHTIFVYFSHLCPRLNHSSARFRLRCLIWFGCLLLAACGSAPAQQHEVRASLAATGAITATPTIAPPMPTAVPTTTPTVVPPRVQSVDLTPLFAGYQGCFVLFDITDNAYTRYNDPQCARQLSPCSTFKIPHALIGLDLQLLRDREHLKRWDGTVYRTQSHNQDHTLASAMANSVVWYFQSLAGEIGEERMKVYLDRLDYGNRDISGGLTEFWRQSSLTISADEQIAFLRRLYADDLPVSQHALDTVKSILILAESEAGTLRGKTGSCREGEHHWGWFVGYLERGERVYMFATNIEVDAPANGRDAQRITEDVLRQLKLW